MERHPKNDQQEKGKIFLEFFFDGSPAELAGRNPERAVGRTHTWSLRAC